jgi:ADP-ribosyl-[dinitrogen reductase] hydrolase
MIDSASAATRTMDQRDRFRGCLLGLAVGDAVGTTVEFRARGSFKPLTDMVGGGPFDLLPGQWTDDTSMALCLGTSLVACGAFDARDQMQRYCRWQEEGYLSSTGECFDIGRTVAAALDRFREHGQPFAGSKDPLSAGNGCLMRQAPVAMYFFPNLDDAERFGAESSRTTHGAAECVDACRLFARMICRALEGRGKAEIAFGDADTFVGTDTIVGLARGEFREKPESGISGSGYVVESLEAALWSFLRTDSFEAAVLTAGNLGDDADTTAAICGQIAGAHYGADGIPAAWLQRLSMLEEITALADQLDRGGGVVS